VMRASVQFYLVTDLQSKTKKCLRVQKGDRLGIYSAYDMSSLCYQFSTDPTHVETLVHVFKNATYPVENSNEAVTFDSVVYPYDFLAEAYYYYGKKLFIVVGLIFVRQKAAQK